MFDTVIVGGSSAGLSAALVLGRSLRKVAVVDDQQPCNRFSRASHGFLTRDGVAPGDLLRIAAEQLGRYPGIRLIQATALQVERTDDGFEVAISDGSRVQARTVLLATGLRDELPALQGIEELWGTSVFHCPYCDGYEVRGKVLAIYGQGATSLHQAMLLRNLTDDLTLCAGWALSSAQRERLDRAAISVVERPIEGLESTDARLTAIRFDDGSTLACDALFIRPHTTHRTSFARDLGCEIDEQNVVVVDLRGRTTVEGVYAAGDIASPMRSVAIAVAQGAAAAYGINGDLAERDYP